MEAVEPTPLVGSVLRLSEALRQVVKLAQSKVLRLKKSTGARIGLVHLFPPHKLPTCP